MFAFIILSFHWVIASILAGRIIMRRMPVGSSLAWLSLLFFIPILGIILYLLIGEAFLGKKRQKAVNSIGNFYNEFFANKVPNLHNCKSTLSVELQGISHAATTNNIFSAYNNNDIQILDNTTDIINSIIEDIHNAKHNCALEFYIIDPQGRVLEIFDALINASKRGVKCNIIADAIGSKSFFKSKWPEHLQANDISIINTLPTSIIKTFLIRGDLRNHRKIIIIDSMIAYTGSFNLADPEYFKKSSGVGQWVDAMVRCQGPIVHALAGICYADIFIEHGRDIEKEIIKQKQESPDWFDLTTSGSMTAQVVASGPDQFEHVIYESLISLIYSAKKSLVITTPYFVPDESILLAITVAAKRGVDVTLLVPKKIDSIMVRFASRSHFKTLLDAGVKIAQYHEGLLHTKAMLIDDAYCIFGTANIDMRSFYLNLEVSLLIFDRDFSLELSKLLQSYLNSSEYVSKEQWNSRPIYKTFLENILRLASPLL